MVSVLVAVGIAVVSALATFIAGYAVVKERMRVLDARTGRLERQQARIERWIHIETGRQTQIEPRRENSDVIALRMWEDSDRS